MISCPSCKSVPAMTGPASSGYCECRRFYVFDGDDSGMLEFHYSAGRRRVGQGLTWRGGFMYHSQDGTVGYGVLVLTEASVLDAFARVLDAALADEVLCS